METERQSRKSTKSFDKIGKLLSRLTKRKKRRYRTTWGDSKNAAIHRVRLQEKPNLLLP